MGLGEGKIGGLAATDLAKVTFLPLPSLSLTAKDFLSHRRIQGGFTLSLKMPLGNFKKDEGYFGGPEQQTTVPTVSNQEQRRSNFPTCSKRSLKISTKLINFA